MRSEFEKRLEQHIDSLNLSFGLLEPLKYVLLNRAKRIRPLLVLLIAEAIGKNQDVYPAAFCTEFFHTASLIADDLPCMDDDDIRREKKSLHKAFDEQTALLVSYGLISQAFQEIHSNFLVMKEGGLFSNEHETKVFSIAMSQACHFSGFKGAVEGQYLDLKSNKQNLQESEKINEGKTGALFVGTFILGFLFGGGELNKLEKVKECAWHFGAAFQIYDDLKDIKQDREKKSLANIALILGQREAKKKCQNHLRAFLALSKEVFKDPSLLNQAVNYCFKKMV